MSRTYDQLLPYAFKKFSIKSAVRTFIPTVGYYLNRKPLPPSEKPALFTMNILPPMMTVWYHFVKKYLGDQVDVTIFDCSGKLNPKDFPGARVQKFLNLYAATKSDEFLKNIATNREIGWICDDDMFPLSADMLKILNREFADPKTASVSFRPREWWHLEIDGKSYEPSSSYCIAFNREILVKQEKLSLAPANGNTHPSHIGKPPGRYDTFDKANEVLIRKGYRCAIVSKEERDRCLTGFTGMSGAVILLDHFKTPEQVMDYYLSPPKEQWSGNVLFGTLSAMLAVHNILVLYKVITGKTYSMPSLPSRADLEKIRNDHKQYFRSDQSSAWYEDVAARLLAAV